MARFSACVGTAAFAEACIDLLGDRERCRCLGLAARETAWRLYSPAAAGAQRKALCAKPSEATNS